VADSEQRLHAILEALEECQAGLIDCGSHEAAHLLALAILEIRMKLNKVSDSELKALCDAVLEDAPAKTQDLKPLHPQRWRPVLKVIK
jgi:uncharacterized protein YgbK (DUF1537 family)